jgi:hypothetical protein
MVLIEGPLDILLLAGPLGYSIRARRDNFILGSHGLIMD